MVGQPGFATTASTIFRDRSPRLDPGSPGDPDAPRSEHGSLAPRLGCFRRTVEGTGRACWTWRRRISNGATSWSPSTRTQLDALFVAIEGLVTLARPALPG